MNNLSDRLLTIANNISLNESVCDIGTDHGYLGIYLNSINNERKIILSDISEPSLNKSIVNSKKSNSNNIEFRLGDGLNVLDYNEVDCVCIAGMGGLLISDILNKDLNKSHSIKKYVLQPRNHIGELRYYLKHNGFSVINQELVKEGRFICEILTVISKTDNLTYNELNLPSDAIEWEVPKTLLNANSELLKDYLNRKLLREKRILFNIMASSIINSDKVNLIKHNIEYLNSMVKEI